jgi:membrane protease YdiL (CAAX protease family)
MLINGIFFATIHLDPWVFIPTLIIGVLLAYIFEKTKSLPLVIIAHAINNSIAFLV